MRYSFDAKIESYCYQAPKLTLGTAQLGMPYGIANYDGRPNESKAVELIIAAVNAGVNTIDTARAYGLAEQRIGVALRQLKKPVQIISKLDPLANLALNAAEAQVREAVRISILTTCTNLQVETIDIILLHRWQHREQWQGVVWDELIRLIAAGKIKKLGASVNNCSEAIAALAEKMVAYIQCPVNIVDWRWWQESFLTARAKRPDVIFCARSVYLQGLFTIEAACWPSFAGVDSQQLSKILDHLVKQFTRINWCDLCLAYVRGLPWVTTVVLGMENKQQLHENLHLFKEPSLAIDEINYAQKIMITLPENFLNPSLWCIC